MCIRESQRVLAQVVQWPCVPDVAVLLLVHGVWGHWDDMLRIRTKRYAECFVSEALWRSRREEAVGSGELSQNIGVSIGCRIMWNCSSIKGEAMTVRTWIHRGWRDRFDRIVASEVGRDAAA